MWTWWNGSFSLYSFCTFHLFLSHINILPIQKVNRLNIEQVLTSTQELQNNKNRLWMLPLNYINCSQFVASSRISGILQPWEIYAVKLEIDVLWQGWHLQDKVRIFLCFSFFLSLFYFDWQRNLVGHGGEAVNMNFPLELLDMKFLLIIIEILQKNYFFIRYTGKHCGTEGKSRTPLHKYWLYHSPAEWL